MSSVIKKVWNDILTFLACAFLFAFSYPAFVDPVPISTQRVLNLVQWISWIAFAADLVFGLSKAENWKIYFKHHPLEIAAVVLPFLRPLRLMRVISIGGLAIQKIAIGRQLGITIKVFLTSLFVAYISAVQITITERAAYNSNIKNFGDGLWWAITTVTTIGYGDRYPITAEGRFLAAATMIMGISLMGVITASVAAWFIKMGQEDSGSRKKLR